MREKQKLRRIYRVLENQFRNYLSEALRRPGVTGENLLQLLETRMDNVIYRLASPRRAPRPARWSRTVTSRSTVTA